YSLFQRSFAHLRDLPSFPTRRSSDLEMKVVPREEWANIFRETWRIQREFFYDPKMQGADWEAVYRKYLPLLEHVGHRADLGYLIDRKSTRLNSSHVKISYAVFCLKKK